MKKFKNITELNCNLHLIPEVIAIDVLKRIVDWLTTPGTNANDIYKKTTRIY